jgi:CheY-like chemotaxis protein
MINPETMSILIVDDMKSMRLTIRKMLKNLNIGGTLRFAGDGREGLEVLHNTKCDMAILDWNMPVMNGIEMLENIRNDKVLRDMPVIMVTAEAERDIVVHVAETEIDAYLLKPLTLAALDQKIKQVVERANHPDKATQHRLKARQLEEEGDFDGAIQHVRIALKHKPSASRLLRQLGLLHFNIGKPGVGEKCLLKAASVNRQDTTTRVHLAEYYAGKGEIEKAGKYYLEILSLSVKHNDTAMTLAEKLLKNNFRHLAIELLTKVITRSRHHNAAREKVIDLCLANNEYDFPQHLLAEGIKENPSNYDMVYKAGMVHLEMRDYEQAMACFIQVDRHVRAHMDTKLQIAKLYYMNGKILQADDYLNQILRIDSKNKEALALRREI